MDEIVVKLRALSAEEVQKFRNALIADLRKPEWLENAELSGWVWKLENGGLMKWDFGKTYFPDDRSFPDHICGSMGCAMGRIANIPFFQKEGFKASTFCGVRFIVGGDAINSQSLLTRAIAHYLGITAKLADSIFWGGRFGMTPHKIADNMEKLLSAPEDVEEVVFELKNLPVDYREISE